MPAMRRTFQLVCGVFAGLFFCVGIAVAGSWNSANGLILRGTVVPMTGEQDVIENGQILIQNEQIVAIIGEGESWPVTVNPTGAVVVDTDGYIFPGMINLHNHTAYNTLPLWEAPKLYQNRYQWTGAKSYSTYVNYPKKLLTDSNYYNLVIEVAKYAEVKGMVGGETGIQGTPNRKGVNDMLIRNVETKNFDQDKVFQRGLSIEDYRWQKTVPAFLTKADAGLVDAWIVHLAEGIDADPSLAEFTLLTDLDMLHEWTVVIHGTALTTTEFGAMGTANAELVWSPLSNLLLYGKTTRVDQAMSAGVTVSLATDWSPSGGKNLLDEIKIAYEVNKWYAQTVPGYLPFDEYTLAQMVTVNPANALEWNAWVGTLEVGKYADIMVIAKPEGSTSPYQALIDATVRDVVLVTVSGEPLYGDVDVMQSTKGTDMEVLCSTAGFVKAIDVTREGKKKGEQTWATITDTLDQAMQFDHEHMRTAFKVSVAEAWTIEEFDAWFATKFKNGVVPMDVDPLYSTDDPVFFQRIAASTNAALPFDLQAIYYGFLGDGPTASAGLGLDESELLAFVNATTQEELTGDVGLSPEEAAAIMGVLNTTGLFATKAALLAVTGNCGLVVIEAYIAKLKEPPPPPDPVDPPPVVGPEGLLLAMLNHESTTFKVLDDDVKLTKTAAQTLITYRDGPDATFGTEDDNLFNSEAEVDAVSYVGPSALGKLYSYAATWEPPSGGVPADELKLVAFLNDAKTTFQLLDVDVGLNKNAALHLIAHRDGPDSVFGTVDDDPYDSLDEVDAVSYVGPTALTVLMAWAQAWIQPNSNDELLVFVNDPKATFVVFDIDVGLTSLAAGKIVAHRDGPDAEPGTGDDDLFQTIDELDAVPYVGPSALGKLKEYAAVWATVSKELALVCQFLNHETTDYDVLVTTVGVSKKASNNILSHRNGPDGQLGTVDDNPFDAVSEVDDVPHVGSVTLGKLEAFAEQWVAP